MRSMVLMLLLTWAQLASAVIEDYPFETPEQARSFAQLTNELRCPKCQNQSIADSNAPIAYDLRREVFRLLNDGSTPQQVLDFMLARYGDFVLYTPRKTGATAVLWIAPWVLLAMALLSLALIVRQHKRRGREAVAEAPQDPRVDALFKSQEKQP